MREVSLKSTKHVTDMFWATRLIREAIKAAYLRYRYYMLMPIPALEREVLELAKTTFSHI